MFKAQRTRSSPHLYKASSYTSSVKRNLAIRMILSILIVVLAATHLLAFRFSYLSVFMVVAGLVLFMRGEFEKNRKVGETLFLAEFGAAT